MKALQEEDEFEIPMTSLIDMVFLLLIFFLVATNFIRREVDHAVVLPQSEAGIKPERVPSRLVVNIRESGALIVNGNLMTEAELRLAVQDFVRVHPGKPAVIRADARVPYQSVMRVFGVARAGGVTNVDLPVLEPGSQ